MKKTTFYNFLPTKAEEEGINRHGGELTITLSEIDLREIGPDTPTVNYLDNNNNNNNNWALRKVLTPSDIDDMSSLCLPEGFHDIKENILRNLQNSVARNILIGIQEIIRIKDVDTGSYHHMILCLDTKTDSFFIKGHWKIEFVLRRNLESGFLIGFRWNVAENCLDFSLLNGEQLTSSSLAL